MKGRLCDVKASCLFAVKDEFVLWKAICAMGGEFVP